MPQTIRKEMYQCRKNYQDLKIFLVGRLKIFLRLLPPSFWSLKLIQAEGGWRIFDEIQVMSTPMSSSSQKIFEIFPSHYFH